MNKAYTYLSAEERASIMMEHGKGMSLRAIARERSWCGDGLA